MINQIDHSSMEEVVVPEHDISPDHITTNESATEHSEMVDNMSDNMEDDLSGETSDLEENGTSPSQLSVLRRSSRTRRPPTRYGEWIGYPDCYTSSSDSDWIQGRILYRGGAV